MVQIRTYTGQNGEEDVQIIKNEPGLNRPRYRIDNSGESPEVVEREDWLPPTPPSPGLSLSSGTIVADGSDTVTVTIEPAPTRSGEVSEATLTVAGDAYAVDTSGGSGSRQITTSSTADTITVEVSHPLPNDPRDATAVAEIEVVQP